MKSNYINPLDNGEKLYASNYEVVITYPNGEEETKDIVQYSFKDVFEVLTEMHEDENNREAISIAIKVKK